MTSYTFRAGYTKLGVATTPSSPPTITVVDEDDTVIVTDAAVTALSNLAGLYIYVHTGVSGLALIGKFHTTDATIDQQDLFTTPDSDAVSGSGTGTGSVSVPIQITNGSVGLDGAKVWATTDVEGTNVVVLGFTNAFGNITFLLDPGTYYIWKELSGYTFPNPSTKVVT